jgi:hypothetical protein
MQTSDFFSWNIQALAVYTFEQHLIRMLEKAKFKIEIVSPWIKRQTWRSIKVSIARFIGMGGSLRVFISDEESCFLRGLGDDIWEEVEVLVAR